MRKQKVLLKTCDAEPERRQTRASAEEIEEAREGFGGEYCEDYIKRDIRTVSRSDKDEREKKEGEKVQAVRMDMENQLRGSVPAGRIRLSSTPLS
jgi:hypothetical protein